MPFVGEISMFAFGDNGTVRDLIKQGWVACEGQSFAKKKGPNGLPNLHKVIREAWGSDDPNAFNVPDMRGQFLRGWDHGAKIDPDADTRISIREGAATGDIVGSAQPDAFAQHNHKIRGGTPVPMIDNWEDACPTHPDARQTRGNSNMMEGGAETRPRNVYVMYCIWTGHAPLPTEAAKNFFAKATGGSARNKRSVR